MPGKYLDSLGIINLKGPDSRNSGKSRAMTLLMGKSNFC